MGGKWAVTKRDWNDSKAASSPRVPPNTCDSQKLQPGALCMPCRQLHRWEPQSLASVGLSPPSYSLLLWSWKEPLRALQVLPAKALTFSLASDAWSLPSSRGGDVPVEQNCSTASSEAHIQSDSPVPEKKMDNFRKNYPHTKGLENKTHAI